MSDDTMERLRVTVNDREQMLELAAGALARMVKAEYPEDRTLTEIMRTWGDATAEEIEAVRYVIVRDGITDDTAAIQAKVDSDAGL